MPLSEVTFAAKMRDNGYVLELMDRSEDDHCHYLVSPLARGEYCSLGRGEACLESGGICTWSATLVDDSIKFR